MRITLLVLVAMVPVIAVPAGGHDKVGCVGCHSMHTAKGDILFALRPNKTLLDPRTGNVNETLSALCLSCHADPADGGRGVAPVSSHFRHPFSRAKVNPKLARVPAELLREGRFECVACHDPHPSNPNYRYLRIAVARTPTLSELCTVCHPRQADPTVRAQPLFSSMDERATRPVAAK